jgi:hypothetical protein
MFESLHVIWNFDLTHTTEFSPVFQRNFSAHINVCGARIAATGHPKCRISHRQTVY